MSIHTGKALNIDISTRCALECPACQRTIFRKAGKRVPGKDVTLAQFDKISDHFANGGRISFCGTFSDPIFNPNFIDMLKMCHKKRIRAEVHTAASQKPERWYQEAFLANPEASWWFGIDGLPEQSHQYRINQDGVKLFNIMLQAKKKVREVIWQYLIFDYNRPQIKKAKLMARKYGVSILFINTLRDGKRNEGKASRRKTRKASTE